MRRLFPLLSLLLFPLLAAAQPWTPTGASGCIGGSKCPQRRLTVRLEDRPVVGIRFTANDSVGSSAGGELRIMIDRTMIRGGLDVPRRGETFTLDVDNVRGSQLIFEPATNDEVQINDVEVRYGREVIQRDRGYDDRPGPGGGSGGGSGWRSYPDRGCIGGNECRKNGTRITIALDNAPVLGVRFFAHDNIGTKADGRLTVKIDDTSIASYVDVQRNGQRHELDVDNLRGSRLVIQTATDDEVEISDIAVLYGRRSNGGGGGGYGGGGRPNGGGGWGETTHEGGCIGGSTCGGKRARIRVPLRDRAVAEVRFFAHDNVGAKAGGELRIRVDDTIIRDYLDIPRDGRTFTIDGRGVYGRELIIEPAEDDEVVIKDIRVTYQR
ncbi:MAG: hypothetical protein JOZ54_01840 [Acidobacteria bacterium]|nr:hypothetical protein [Acidobacteriota bacterium]